jgi:serine/threonine protein kinase
LTEWIPQFDRTAITGTDRTGRPWIVQENKGVGIEELPQIQRIINGSGTQEQKEERLARVHRDKMRQLDKELTKVNKQGWVHKDVHPNNVRWNERTGKPTLIDWGLAEKWREPATGLGKVGEWFNDQKKTWPKDTYDHNEFYNKMQTALTGEACNLVVSS